MNILVTGANGQLGNELRILAKSIPAPNNTDCHTFLFTDISQAEDVETTFLDITDLDAIRKIVQDNHINAIINCAAWTNVDAAESNEQQDKDDTLDELPGSGLSDEHQERIEKESYKRDIDCITDKIPDASKEERAFIEAVKKLSQEFEYLSDDRCVGHRPVLLP